MRIKIGILACVGLIALSSVAPAQEGLFACPSSAQASVQFSNGQMAGFPSYAEGDGARVQRQHPDTYLYAQAKFLNPNGNGVGVGVCQYSNHVGWVAVFAATKVARSISQDNCRAGRCEGIARWRREHTNAETRFDKPGQESIMVCVQTKNGIAHPSAGCRFQMVK